MTALGYIADTEELVKTSLLLFHYDSLAAFKLSEQSPVPSALSANDLTVGRNRTFKVC
jgi:hypothetical protein